MRNRAKAVIEALFPPFLRRILPHQVAFTKDLADSDYIVQRRDRQVRAISQSFLETWTNGHLKPLLEYVRKDPDLDLFLRGEWVNIYFKGASLLRLKGPESSLLAGERKPGVANRMGVLQKPRECRAQGRQKIRRNRRSASCSSKGRLTFDLELLKQPAAFRAEVIVHELLHLRIPNHGPLFKAMVEAYLAKFGLIY